MFELHQAKGKQSNEDTRLRITMNVVIDLIKGEDAWDELLPNFLPAWPKRYIIIGEQLEAILNHKVKKKIKNEENLI